MRIAIVTTQCPFVTGGAELHAENLKRALLRAGHEAEIVSIPYKWYPPESILDHMLAARNFDISEFNGVKIDLAICLKFPAYLMRHRNKVYWILHQERSAYDLWDAGLSDLFHSDQGQMVRAAVRQADVAELSGNQRIFANSKNVAKRLLHYNGIEAEALYHPPPLAGHLRTGECGDYFYYPSRITALKRQEFVLRALALTKTNTKVIFSGAFDSPAYESELKRLTFELGLTDRVEWRGFVDQATMIDLYANARGVLYTPIDEDLGYVALESMAAGKPLLTLSDAGEPANLIRDESEGLISSPDVHCYASLIDRAVAESSYLALLGEAAKSKYLSLDISWENAVTKLTIPVKEKVPSVYRLKPLSFAMKPAEEMEKNKSARRVPAVLKAQPSSSHTGLETILSYYDFGESLNNSLSYLDTHWRRYMTTLDLLRSNLESPKKILDLGVSAPYIFTVLLKEMFPNAEFFGVQERPVNHHWVEKVAARHASRSDLSINLVGLNIETTSLPFDDESFDLVLGMEILEHFAIDPSFVFREVARVTKPNGRFVISTPNLVSDAAIHRALKGDTPYSFGVFVPWNGIYGRHNREYTPREVEELGRYASFETRVLVTADIYAQENLPADFSQQFGKDYLPQLRGQNIFYVGTKNPDLVCEPYPKSLFVVDPAIFDGQLEIIRGTDASVYHLSVTNKGPSLWPCEGGERITLRVDRIDQSGLVSKNVRTISLPHDLGPKEKAEISFSAKRASGTAGAWYEIGLYLENVGAFKEAGRTNTVSIFADAIVLSEGGQSKCA